MQCKFLIADNDRVAGVVATLVSNDVVDPIAEEIGGFSFTLVAPLGAEENDCWHRERLPELGKL